MKMNLLKRVLTWSLLGSAGIFFYACNSEDPKSVPTVVTSTSITDVTVNSAKGGGEITGNGNAGITASGLVYSYTVSVPTISEDKTTESTTTGAFTSTMQGLNSGKKYYVRAYATNEIGTGYGDVVTFTTGNAAPTVTNVTIEGTVQVGETLTVTYDYNDAEGDAQSGTIIQWYMADAVSGSTATNETAISGATASTYVILPEQFGKFFRVSVTPKAATGTIMGDEVKSHYVDGEPTTVTFPYNGSTVTYGVIRSAKTGRKWFDRNLGASGVAATVDDYANYGDLFQWGRGADGHQLMTHSSTTSFAAVNGTTSNLSNSDHPGHSNFILYDPNVSPFDWRNPQNNTLWQGVNGINNPCPTGWRLATEAEWVAEELQNTVDAFSKLKLPLTGEHYGGDGGMYGLDRGYYWSSTVNSDIYSSCIRFKSTVFQVLAFGRGDGMAVRCIKDEGI